MARTCSETLSGELSSGGVGPYDLTVIIDADGETGAAAWEASQGRHHPVLSEERICGAGMDSHIAVTGGSPPLNALGFREVPQSPLIGRVLPDRPDPCGDRADEWMDDRQGSRPVTTPSV